MAHLYPDAHDHLDAVQERSHEVGARSLHERNEGRAREHAGRIFVEPGSRHLGLRLYLFFYEHSCLKRPSHRITRYKHLSDLNYLTGTYDDQSQNKIYLSFIKLYNKFMNCGKLRKSRDIPTGYSASPAAESCGWMDKVSSCRDSAPSESVTITITL